MDILRDSQLVIFSQSTTFITVSNKSRTGFLCEVRGGKNRKWRWIFAFDRCVKLSNMTNLFAPLLSEHSWLLGLDFYWMKELGKLVERFNEDLAKQELVDQNSAVHPGGGGGGS